MCNCGAGNSNQQTAALVHRIICVSSGVQDCKTRKDEVNDKLPRTPKEIPRGTLQ